MDNALTNLLLSHLRLLLLTALEYSGQRNISKKVLALYFAGGRIVQ
jgi:hypothetical protein